MIQITNLSKRFGEHVILKDVSFSLASGDKVGFIGRNGSGKSTLFKMILGEEGVDEGQLVIPRNYSVGALDQNLSFTEDTLLKECMLSLSVSERYDEYKAEKILFGLGFVKEDLHKAPSLFSGGFQLRISLTKALLKKSDLLLLDEPTNYLDIVGLRWLKSYLKKIASEFILITHDRGFMNEVTTHTIGIRRCSIKMIKGNTIKYQQQVAEEDEIYEKTKDNQERERKHMEEFVTRFRAKASLASQAQSRLKKLQKMDSMEVLSKEKTLKLKFNYSDCPSKVLLEVKNISFSYDGQNLPQHLIDNLSFMVGKNDRIGIIGKNGKGKTTLLRLLASELKEISGEQRAHPKLQIGYFAQTNIKDLFDDHSIEQEIATANQGLSFQQIKRICGTMMFDGTLSQKKIKILSGGEKSRVLLGKILATSSNLLLLDEPTNHLDQESVESLINGLEDYPGALALVTHSERILKKVVNKLIVFHRNRVEFFNGDYNYFLEKIGWEEELDDEDTGQQQPAKQKLTRKEIKTLKADLIAEKSRALRPLKKRIDYLESQISDLEVGLEAFNKELLEASMESDGQKIKESSQKIKSTESEIEKFFSKLEMVTTDYESKASVFDQKLAEIES